MTTPTESTSAERPSLAVQAEAAAWLARLHGPQRTAADERSFRRWLNASPTHAQAFERATELWTRLGQLKSDALRRASAQRRPRASVSFQRGALAAGLICVAIVGAFFWLHSPVVTTGVGEQRTLVLQDGTRVILNTSTRLEVKYDEHTRRVELLKGEALFEVAKKPNWPFVVTVGDREITALGTAFVVRRDAGERVSVTLVEGTVKVAPVPLPSEPVVASVAEVTVLSPGQRLTLAPDQPPEIDEPSLDKVTAWRRGVVNLDGMLLADAVAEMNRYSTVEIVLEHPDAAKIRVSGVFRAGDSLEFSKAVARAYNLRVVEEPHRIVLSAAPGA